MDNPGPKLRAFLERHYPSLKLGKIISTARDAAVYLEATTTTSLVEYQFTIGFPRNAPENAWPLVWEARHRKRSVWSFRNDVQPYVGVTAKTRVHLYGMTVENSVVFLLVVVNEGDPDVVVSVLRVDGTRLSDKLEAVLKTNIAGRWGMRYELTDEERGELESFLPRKPKS